MTENEVTAVMNDIKFLSAEAKIFMIDDMIKEDHAVVQMPVIKRWIKRNQKLWVNTH